MKISVLRLVVLTLVAPLLFAQTVPDAGSKTDGKWTVYSGDPAFMTLADTIDKGRIIYHKDAQNFSSVTGNRGVLFSSTFVAFPSLNGSFAWSQVRINEGAVSFYPHIFTVEGGESTLSLAILYNIARVSPVRGVRTRPSFSPTSILQLEKEKMNFTRIKFVSEGYSTVLNLQVANQETELSLSDYEVNYTYWMKARPNKQETDNLKAFFTRPLKSFKIRAYSDKGYLDTTIEGVKVPVVSDIFVKSISLYERLIDPKAAAELAAAQRAATTNTQVKRAPAPAPAPAARPAVAAPAARTATPVRPAATTPAARPAATPARPAATPARAAATPARAAAATPAARPAATPAARPAATPAARPAATPAARPAATPAARPATTNVATNNRPTTTRVVRPK